MQQEATSIYNLIMWMVELFSMDLAVTFFLMGSLLSSALVPVGRASAMILASAVASMLSSGETFTPVQAWVCWQEHLFLNKVFST